MKDSNNSLYNENDDFTDDILNNIISCSDKEILKEVEEDYKSKDLEIDKIKGIINSSITNAGKENFHKLKQALDAKSNKKAFAVEPENYRDQLNRFIKENEDMGNSLTLAARNGTKLSENDAKGILEDLIELRGDIQADE